MHNIPGASHNFKSKSSPYWMLLIAIFLVLSNWVVEIHGQTQASVSTEVTFSPAPVAHSAPAWPISITQVLLEGKPIPLAKVVSLSSQQSQHLTIEVRNTTKKVIVCGTLMVQFPETAKTPQGNPASFLTAASNLGRQPDSAYRMKDGSRRTPNNFDLLHDAIEIPPGGVMRFEFNHFGSDLEQASRQAGKIHSITIQPNIVYFADGSRWFSGDYMVPVPAPALWRTVPLSQF